MPDVQMNYGDMANMSKLFRQGSEQFQSTIGTVNNIIAILEGGGLVGNMGSALTNQLQSILLGKLQGAISTFDMLAGAIDAASSDMSTADH
jgi:hypothetical protein